MRRKSAPKIIDYLKAPGPKRLEGMGHCAQGLWCEGFSGRTQELVCDCSSSGGQKRVTIGTYPAVALAEARGEARKIIRDAQLGVLTDPQRAPAPTLGETVSVFVQLYAKPKNRGWE